MPAQTYHHGNLRTALLEAAAQTLRDGGVDQLSLRELARQVGVSHAAPRRHFPDRQALLDALAVSGFERIRDELRSALDAADADFTGRFRAVALTYVRFATEDSALLELMFTSKHRPGADARIEEAAIESIEPMRDVVLQGQAEDRMPAGDPDRVGMVAFAMLHGIATLANSRFIAADELPGVLEQAIEQFVHDTGA